jgi:hypothetical protein
MRATNSLLALLMLGACAPPVVVYRPAADAVAEEHSPLTVVMRDGSSVRMQNARISGDTLVGMLAAAVPDTVPNVRVPLSAVERITRDGHGLNTLGSGAVGVMTGVFLGGLAFIALISAALR